MDRFLQSDELADRLIMISEEIRDSKNTNGTNGIELSEGQEEKEEQKETPEQDASGRRS